MGFSLSRAWSRLRTVPGLGRDVAVLVLVIAASAVTFAIINANTSGILPWQQTRTYRAEFASVPAVNPKAHMDVMIAGVKIGVVSGWEATDHNTAILDMTIEPGVTAPIYENAQAVLRSKNPLNELYIEINPGDSPARPMGSHGMIPIARTKTIVLADAALAHLDQRTQSALTGLMLDSDAALARAPEQLPQGLRATDKTLIDARPVLEALQTRRQKIAELVTALSQIAGAVGGNHERAVKLAQSVQDTLGVLAANDRDLKASLDQLPGLNKQLRNALSATQPLTQQLDPVLQDLDHASEKLPKALDRFQDTVDNVGEVVDAARPVLRRARPVVSDLRPLIGDFDRSLDDLETFTRPLGHDLGIVESYLEPLRAFVYNTTSVFGVRDAQGANVRGFFVAELPDDQFFPGGETRNAPGASDGMHPGHAPRTPRLHNDRVPNQQGPERGQNPLLPMMGATGGNGSNGR